MNKMSKSSRIVIAVASLAWLIVYFVPVWFIFLIAPQYPEGLTMYIWLDKITGEVDIINGLNHYIGMKKINAAMFPEFSFLVYIVGFFLVFGLVVAINGRRKLLAGYLYTLLVFGIIALIDFYKWGYEYGHNLDPTAPIQVPGLFYQPPVIGHKTLLNFDAYSYPDIGGWVVIAIAVVLFLVWLLDWRKERKARVPGRKSKKVVPAVAVMAMLLVSSCSNVPEPINYGKDQCDDCRMTIVDEKFSGEIVTQKGRVFKFDDARCIVHFIRTERVPQSDISKILFSDYKKKNFIDATTASFVVSPQIKSPMNSNTAAFAGKDDATELMTATNGKIIDWETLKNK